jgi:hypothetical protein
MRTIWRALLRTVFWSFERGTVPYDVAVVVIVIFVMLSPRSWFHDRPRVGPPPNPAMVQQLKSADPSGSVETFRVDARLLAPSIRAPESELEHQLHEAVSKNVQNLHRNDFQILRIEPVHADDGTVAYYDVSIKP